MKRNVSSADKSFKTRLILPAILLGIFLITSMMSFVSTLLPDIASSFGVSVGTMSVTGVVVNSTGLVMGLVMGVLTVRFQHKSLFLFGLIMYLAGALGLFFSQNFATVLFFNFFSGVGRAVVFIMALAMIGELFPLEKRGWLVGLSVAASSFALIFVPILSASIARAAGWRAVVPWFTLPLSVVALVIAWFAIPYQATGQQPPRKSLYLEAFKQVLLNKSAIACVISTALFTLSSAVAVYAVSFYRISFSVSQVTGGVFASVASTGAFLGGIAGGRLVNRSGRKPLFAASAFISSLATIIFTFMPGVLFSIAFWTISAAAAGIAMASLRSLVLEQVSRFRGSMMSVNQSFDYIGAILALVIGGTILNLYANNFHVLMIIFGASGIASVPIVLLLSRDPTKNQLAAKK